MALETLIYPGSSSFFPGQTPFGIYDDDYNFQEEAPKKPQAKVRNINRFILEMLYFKNGC
jgi:hypothetical protein